MQTERRAPEEAVKGSLFAVKGEKLRLKKIPLLRERGSQVKNGSAPDLSRLGEKKGASKFRGEGVADIVWRHVRVPRLKSLLEDVQGGKDRL